MIRNLTGNQRGCLHILEQIWGFARDPEQDSTAAIQVGGDKCVDEGLVATELMSEGWSLETLRFKIQGSIYCRIKHVKNMLERKFVTQVQQRT